MTVNDMPEGVDLSTILVRVPEKALEHFKAFGGGERLMYPVGEVEGYGFMMSPDEPEADERRMYPFPPEVDSEEMLTWELDMPAERSKGAIAIARTRARMADYTDEQRDELDKKFKEMIKHES